MSGFAREHLRPLLGSAGLHLLLIVLAGVAAMHWTSTEPPVQLAIEGVVVDARTLPKSVRSGKVLPPVEELQPPPAPAPAVDREAEQRAAAEAAARATERARAETERTERERVNKEALAAEQKKQQESEARREKAADDARRKAEADAERRKAAEADAEIRKAEQAQAARDAKAKAQREADLKRRLAAEEAEGAALARPGVVDEYRALLVQAIERNWIRPPSARAGLTCTLYVNQATGGTVMDVKLGPCNGDDVVRESIVTAVYRASPLPAPSDPRAFERRLEIVFRPTE
jgi:colicin import membrane protein